MGSQAPGLTAKNGSTAASICCWHSAESCSSSVLLHAFWPARNDLSRAIGSSFQRAGHFSVGASRAGGGDRLEEAGPSAFSSRFDRLFGCRVHGHDVVAIHLLTDETRCDRLLRQRFGCSLKPQRYGNSPLIIDGDEHDRQLVHAREIHRFIDVALRGGAVTDSKNTEQGRP